MVAEGFFLPIIPFRGMEPQVDPSAFIAPNAYVIGNVTLGPRTGVWFNVTIRGDGAPIVIEEGSNLQEGVIVHIEWGKFSTRIGKNVTVGHGAIVHGCEVGDDCIIGMGAVLLNGCKIGPGSIVAAGSVVPEGKEYPPGMLLMGVPARAVRPVTPEEQERIRSGNAAYQALGQEFRDLLK